MRGESNPHNKIIIKGNREIMLILGKEKIKSRLIVKKIRKRINQRAAHEIMSNNKPVIRMKMIILMIPKKFKNFHLKMLLSTNLKRNKLKLKIKMEVGGGLI